MRRHVLPLIAFALIAMNVSAQQPQPGGDRAKSAPVTQITIEGKQIKGDNVLVRKGITYVSVPALAQALGASVSSQGAMTVLSTPAAPEPALWERCRRQETVRRLPEGCGSYSRRGGESPGAREARSAYSRSQFR